MKKIESWEKDITPNFKWDNSESKEKIIQTVKKLKEVDAKNINKYKQAVSSLFNKGPNPENMNAYKQSVLNLLQLKPKSEPKSEPKSTTVESN